ncbi:MipA/OmpV family protein [Pseudoalteromonas sp. Scap03]|nr:MipA/OmpV family protein [Pseudoalteromonas sp. Scap03]QLE82948.1 MipA/OmpV family protein [Pseudoalteromonas sp. Scap25]QLE90890.1 MipA/OmpV family protein [Pseudoalteromonas sp. Scap06]
MVLFSANAIAQTQQNITTDELKMSVSLGVGVISNPLYGADNIPLVVVPQVAYYGQNWFFDNGRLGYSFIQSDTHNISFVSEINPESRFFIDWHPKNIFPLTTMSNNEILESQDVESPRQININNIQKRRVVLDAGVSYVFVKQQQVFSAQLLHDVNSVYNSYRGSLQWQYHFDLKLLKLKSTLGVNYKSAKLNNYFYGLNSAEFSYGKIEVGSSWQPYAKIDARWPVGKANALRFHLAYYDYSAMDSSPLFEHDYSMTAFIGFEHTF